jgi:hypothetical protein
MPPYMPGLQGFVSHVTTTPLIRGVWRRFVLAGARCPPNVWPAPLQSCVYFNLPTDVLQDLLPGWRTN